MNDITMTEYNIPLIAREGIIDRDNYKFTEKILRKMDNSDVPVFRDFDYSRQIGRGTLKYIKGKGLSAKIRIINGEYVIGMVPCLGLKVERVVEGVHDVGKYWKYHGKAEALSIGLCKENADAGIQPLRREI